MRCLPFFKRSEAKLPERPRAESAIFRDKNIRVNTQRNIVRRVIERLIQTIRGLISKFKAPQTLKNGLFNIEINHYKDIIESLKPGNIGHSLELGNTSHSLHCILMDYEKMTEKYPDFKAYFIAHFYNPILREHEDQTVRSFFKPVLFEVYSYNPILREHEDQVVKSYFDRVLNR